jgi:ribonuclease BN (tRNA processing enzyme)
VILTTIGTGTAAPSATRVSAGHLVEAGDVRLLLDCGSGVVHRMAALGVSWQAITHVAITHFHGDHTSDLAMLFTAWRYGDLPPRSAPVTVIGPPGTLALVARIEAAFGLDVHAMGFEVSIGEVPTDGTIVLAPEVTLRAIPVPHTPESVAYCVEHAGHRLVYSGDTAFDEGFGAWAAGCDLLLLECSLPASFGVTSHLTPEQCGALAALARPRHLVLTHFYPPLEGADVLGPVTQWFAGPVTLASDGARFAL